MAELTVGLIGVGHMGNPMAMRLLDQGVKLMVCDRNLDAVTPLRDRGATVANSPLDLANACHVVIASLPSREASLEVALGEKGVIGGNAIRVYIETSTLGSATTQAIADGLRKREIGFVDAPVSGGAPGARAGTLAVLASGSERDFCEARPVLEALAGKLFHLGEKPGLSQVAKLINNHVSAAGRMAVFEGLAMGIKAGIDPKILNDVFNAGSARNYTTTDKVHTQILTGTYNFGAALSLGLKDEALLIEEAERYGAPVWIAPRILEIYREAAAAGYRDQDSMRVFLYMQSQSLPDGGAKVAPEWREESPKLHSEN